jgi:predicted GNAT superfamily acetyltransferase
MTETSHVGVLRSARADDLPAVRQLNNDAVPAVNALELADLEEFLRVGHTFLVAEHDGVLTGALVGLGPGLDYPSLNYRWFSARYQQFIYVDRVVVSQTVRSRGLGTELYRQFAERGRAEGAPVLLAEVNIRPRNDGSLRFHERFGFVSVGEQDTEGGSKRVSLLACNLTTDPTSEPR